MSKEFKGVEVIVTSLGQYGGYLREEGTKFFYEGKLNPKNVKNNGLPLWVRAVDPKFYDTKLVGEDKPAAAKPAAKKPASVKAPAAPAKKAAPAKTAPAAAPAASADISTLM